MAGAHTAIADDYSAVWYNPAGLTLTTGLDFGVGLGFVRADLERLDGVVVGPDPDGDERGLTGDVVPRIRDDGGVMGGVAIGVTRGVGLGFAVYLPSADHLAKLETHSQREPSYTLYDARPERLVLLAALGVEPFDGVRIGAGVNVLFGPQGKVEMYMPLAGGGEANAELALTFRPRVSPYFGVLVDITARVRAGLVYREELRHGELDLDVEADTGLLALAASIESVVFHAPRQVTLGGSWSLTDRLLVDIDATWQQWSHFSDASIAGRAEVEGAGIEIDFRDVVPTGFRDTWAARAGVEYALARLDALTWAKAFEVTGRAGYGHVPSPVPEQDGITNYLDSDVHLTTVGAGVALVDPLAAGRTFMLDLHLQIRFLSRRTHRKAAARVDLDDDGGAETLVFGHPEYETGGTVTSAGVTLGLRF